MRPSRSPVELLDCLSVKARKVVQNGGVEQAGSRAARPIVKPLKYAEVDGGVFKRQR